MMRIRSQCCSMLAVALLAATPAAHAQWAVVDAGAIAQLIQQVQVLEQTLTTAQNELTQAQEQYQAITGNRGMQNLLPGVQRNYLPTSSVDLAAVLSGASASYSALAGQVQQSITANAVMTGPSFAALSPSEQQDLIAARQSAALLQALSDQAITATSGRFAQLQLLINAIPAATDEKGTLDLQARIGAEQTMLANDQSKLGALYRAAQANEWIRRERMREQAIADVRSLRSLPAMGL